MANRYEKKTAKIHTIKINGRPAKSPEKITKKELALLEQAVERARWHHSPERQKRAARKRQKVPPRLWRRVAESLAEAHGITVKQLLYGGKGYKFTIPRARFWWALRQIIRKGKPRYSLQAIAAITGHDHTSVLNALSSGLIFRPYDALRLVNMVGRTFGRLKVLAQVEPPRDSHECFRWWRCSCACGGVVIVNTMQLSQLKRHCGNPQHHDIDAPRRVAAGVLRRPDRSRQIPTP